MAANLQQGRTEGGLGPEQGALDHTPDLRAHHRDIGTVGPRTEAPTGGCSGNQTFGRTSVPRMTRCTTGHKNTVSRRSSVALDTHTGTTVTRTQCARMAMREGAGSVRDSSTAVHLDRYMPGCPGPCRAPAATIPSSLLIIWVVRCRERLSSQQRPANPPPPFPHHRSRSLCDDRCCLPRVTRFEQGEEKKGAPTVENCHDTCSAESATWPKMYHRVTEF